MQIQIKQHSKNKYLGCMLDDTVSRETITLCYKQNQPRAKIYLSKKQIFNSNPDAIVL